MRNLSRREFFISAGVAGIAAKASRSASAASAKPNFVVIMTDDQGYGDLGCYGSANLDTPNINRMAAEGMRFDTFYAAAPICTPTRAAFMTGCYAPRVGLPTPLHTPDRLGLHEDEVTIAELLRGQGYATGCVGKWHLGHQPQHYPTRHGFDEYYGSPLGHFFIDIRREEDRTDLFLRNEEEIACPPVEDMTELFTRESIDFIERHRGEPFFLFLSHTMPHEPLKVPERFRGKSKGGLYGDVIEQIDWSTGQIFDTLRSLGLDDNTYVFFTSDNGPKRNQGSSGPFRGWKHSAYEGGFRVPFIAWGPGRIPAHSTCDELCTVMDVYATLGAIADGAVPSNRVIDGKDITPLLHGDPNALSPHDEFFYFIRDGKLAGIRRGRWKLLVDVETRPWSHEEIALYDLNADPGEKTNLAESNSKKVMELRKRMKAFMHEFEAKRREPGRV